MKNKKHALSLSVLCLITLLITPVFSIQAEEDWEEESFFDNNVVLLDMSCPATAAADGQFSSWKVGPAEETDSAWLQSLTAWHSERETGEGCALSMAASTIWLSEALPVDENTVSLSGAVMAEGTEQLSVFLLWRQGAEILSKTEFRKVTLSEGKRFRFNLGEASGPEGADCVQLALCNADPGQEASWHSVFLSAIASYSPEITLTVSHIGFETEWPKTFTVHSNFRAREALYIVKDDTGQECFRGALEPAEVISGFGGVSWPGYYYRGDLSYFQDEGIFTLEVQLDALPPVSRELLIQYQVLWNRAFAPALLPFKGSRNDGNDQAEALTLWGEKGDVSLSQGELLWSLVRSWSLLRNIFAGNVILTALEEEAFYGAEKTALYVMNREADHRDGLEEENYYLNALSCIARTGAASENILSGAVLLMEERMEKASEDPWSFYAALDLYAATAEERYFEFAAAHVPDITLDRVESLLDYEGLAGYPASIPLREIFTKKGDSLLHSADNAYGLPQHVTPSSQGFFLDEGQKGATAPGGTTLRLLQAAEIAAQSYRYTADRRYLRLVCDQFNWIWGNNPFDSILVADQRVALEDSKLIQGAVLHGIGAVDAQQDIPAWPAQGEEGWEGYRGFSLKNNAAYISALAHLKRIPTVPPKK